MPQENLSEKVSVNINSSTLSQIDLLVDNGYYSNRSDFINHAARQMLDQKQPVIARIVEQNTHSNEEGRDWFIGVYCVQHSELENACKTGKKLRISGYGVLLFEEDCADELICSAVDYIRVRGRVRCSAVVKQHFGLK